MDYQTKYLKYKKKYVECRERYNSNIFEQITDGKVIGKGNFGMIVLPNKNNEVVYKLLLNECKSSEEEYMIHKKMYNTLKDENDDKFLYIPEPKYFANLKTPKEYSYDGEKYNISCIYEMEYMKPLEYGENNKLNGEYYQIQLAQNKEDVIGFRPGMEKEGYFVGDPLNLEKILEYLKPKYKNVPTVNEIFESMGYAFALAWFKAGYYPIDMQFMLSEHKGDIKVVCFDFGLYLSIDNIKYEYNNDTGKFEQTKIEGRDTDDNIVKAMIDIFSVNGYLSLCVGTDEHESKCFNFFDGVLKIVDKMNDQRIKNMCFEFFKNID